MENQINVIIVKNGSREVLPGGKAPPGDTKQLFTVLFHFTR